MLESATAANLGLAGRFAVEEKLTLPRQQSAMIPLLKLPVEAERVSIYNESVQARHPLLGLRFKNPAAQALMQGPVTVFEGGEYAGDSRILDMQPGEERLLSYAVDLATEVEKTTRQEPGPKLLARVVNNTLEVQYTMRETATYLVRNRSGQDRRLIVEHPLRSDWKLVEPEKPAERSRDVYRFVVEVRAGETVKFEVAEEQPRRDPFQVTVTPTRTGFGTPLGIDVWVEGRPVTEETLGLELVRNELHVSHHDRRRDHYFVRNRNDEARTVVLEHVFPEGRRFVEADRGPVMITTRFRRFELQIPAGKTAEVKVSHEAELPVSLALAPTLGGSKAPEGTPNFLPPPELLESLGFAAWVTRQAEPPRLTGATIEKGEVRVARVAKETITYHLENRAETNRTFVLDHRVRDGWRIVGDHKPAFGSAPRYRFEVKAGPKETARHEAAEEFRTTQAVALAKFDDETLKELTDSGVVSPAVKEALRKGVGMSRQLAQTQEALRRLEGRRTQVLEEQTRLRANLEKLPPDTPLYKRYLQKLDEEETALEQVRAQIAEQTRTEERQRRELEVFVDGLTVK